MKNKSDIFFEAGHKEIDSAINLPNQLNSSSEAEFEMLVFDFQNMDHVNTDPEEVSILSKSDFFSGCFFEQDKYNKILLLDVIDEIGGMNEIPLLEKILRTESEDVIKDAARKVLDNILEQYFPNEICKKYFQKNTAINVFEELFEICDAETKLVLLDIIAEIGTKKEIPLLVESINSTSNKLILKKYKEVKLLIERNIRVNFEEVSILPKIITTSPKSNAKAYEFPFKFKATQTIEFEQTINYDNNIVAPSMNLNAESKKSPISLEFCFLADESDISLSQHNTNIMDVKFSPANIPSRYKIVT